MAPVDFGWGAPALREQLPQLPAKKAEHLELDRQAIIRLSARGLLTQSQCDSAFKRLSKELNAALNPTTGEGEQS